MCKAYIIYMRAKMYVLLYNVYLQVVEKSLNQLKVGH